LAGGVISIARGVSIDEFDRLNKHPGGAATGVIDAALERLNHLNQQADNATRGIKFTTFFPLGAGKTAQKVFINPAQDVLRASVFIADLYIVDEVYELAEALLIE